MTLPSGPPATPAPLPTPTAPTATVLHGDCVALMATLPDNSVDSIVTDPPYGLGLMGKEWDALPPGREWAEECFRVLKPGGHLIAFGGTRTWHRLAVAVEDAGFEIRDSFAWLYGSGFPKSLNVSKALDKAAGALGHESSGFTVAGRTDKNLPNPTVKNYTPPAPVTDEAKEWAGWGTALKPAFEPAVLARKPLAPGMTVAQNVVTHGTGALNVDACRIGTGDTWSRAASETSGRSGGIMGKQAPQAAGEGHTAGRWPANILLDEHTADMIDQQSGVSTSPPVGSVARKKARAGLVGSSTFRQNATTTPNGHGDTGGASRFFYVAKAPKRERPVITHEDGTTTAHPTVKPLALMRMLCRLITPPGGVVLEPFAGSGTTIEAALLEGFSVIGIEMTDEYLPLIQARIDRVQGTQATPTPAPVEPAPVAVPMPVVIPAPVEPAQAVLF